MIYIISHICRFDESNDARRKCLEELGTQEISLESFETCNLAEVFPPRCVNADSFYKALEYATFYASTVSLLPTHRPETNAIIARNRRIGVSISGIAQWASGAVLGEWSDMNYTKMCSFLRSGYKVVKNTNVKLAREAGVPASIRVTTVKPSGCSRGDMLVQTSRGLLRLDEIGNTSGSEWQMVQDLSVSSDQEDTFNNVSKFYINGLVDTKKIITEDGFELESSLQHKYRIINDQGDYIWKTVNDLEIGDQLVVKLGGHPTNLKSPLKTVDLGTYNYTVISQPEYLTKDIAWFIGLFYGDGSVHNNGIRISFNRKQPALIKWLIDFAKNTFNITPCIDDDHSIYFNSKELMLWMEKNGCLKQHSYEIEIPKIIRTASAQNILAFIDGFWRADGGIHNTSNSWSVCTVSKTFAQQFLVLCRSIGINVKISCAGPGALGSKDRWIISVRHLNSENLRYISKKLKDRMWNGFWLDPIEHIEDSTCNTYDIEVPDVHHYRLGGVISHNTISLMAGTTPGVHYPVSRYAIRRVRIGETSPLVQPLIDAGVPHEKDMCSQNTLVFEFVIDHGDVRPCDDVSPWEQFSLVQMLQKHYADNCVSASIYFDREKDGPDVEKMLAMYIPLLKSVSMMPSNKGVYAQAPYEPLTQEEYEKRLDEFKYPTYGRVKGNVPEGSKYCSGDHCEL